MSSRSLTLHLTIATFQLASHLAWAQDQVVVNVGEDELAGAAVEDSHPSPDQGPEQPQKTRSSFSEVNHEEEERIPHV